MGQIPGSGFVAQPFRNSCGLLLPTRFASLVFLLLLAAPWVHAQSASAGNPTPKEKPPAVVVQDIPKEVGSPAIVPTQPPANMSPAQPPSVAWDGKQLTIDAENSTLADILNVVRAQTGASIEIPRTASTERVFVHLGPGPPRDILSSLVYGMPFDYIIETAEDDPDTLRRVVLTARGVGDGDAVIAGASDPGEGTGVGGAPLHRGGGDGRAGPGVRMMPGWAGPGMPAFQVDAEAALETQQAAPQDGTPAQDSAKVQDSPALESGASNEATVKADAVESANASNAAPPSTDSDENSGVGQAIQSMTKMFEQRRQIQSQQNQTPRSQQSPQN